MTRPALIAAVVDAFDDRPLPAFADPVSRRRGSLQYTLRELERRRREAQHRLHNLNLQIGQVEKELARLAPGGVER